MTLRTNLIPRFALISLVAFFCAPPLPGGWANAAVNEPPAYSDRSLETEGALGRLDERVTHLLDWHYRLTEGLTDDAIIEDGLRYDQLVPELDSEMSRLAMLMEAADDGMVPMTSVRLSVERSEELARELERTVRYYE